MAATLSPNEIAQLTQTIEMFEVITQSQPNDYQSLEILKEAYFKLDRDEAGIQTSKRIAEAYVHLGQLSSAILEYESILQRLPDDLDVQKALGEIASRANSFAAPQTPVEAVPDRPNSKLNIGKKGKIAAAAKSETEIEDGRPTMQKVFLDSKLISASDFDLFWPVPKLNDTPKAPTDPFISILAEKQILPLDQSMKLLAEKSRLPYLPLEKYDVDIELARTFSRDICLRWTVLPFDRMSKSIMVATANPYNVQATRDLEAHTKSRLVFYFVHPTELTKMLKKIFR